MQYEQFCNNRELYLENVSNLLQHTFQHVILYIKDFTKPLEKHTTLKY
jgi:hypothetical protein